MRALRIYAGPEARRHIESQGLQPADIGVVPAAAGGPKGLILGPLDRFLFGEWLPQTDHTVHLVGASIGAWRMATACLRRAGAGVRAAGARLHRASTTTLPPGRKRPSAGAGVASASATTCSGFYRRAHRRGAGASALSAAHRHLARAPPAGGASTASRTPLGYLGAFVSQRAAPPGHGRLAGAGGVLGAGAGRAGPCAAAVRHRRFPHAAGRC